MTSSIRAAAEKYRKEIHALDNSALVELDRSYRAIAARLQTQLDALTKQIQAAQAQGKQAVLRVAGSGAKLKPNEFSANWLFRQKRYRELLDQTEAEIARYARMAVQTTREQQERALQLGLDHAKGLTTAAVGKVPAGVAWTFNRVPFDAVQNIIGVLRDGSPLEYKFIGLGAETAQAVKDALITGIATGRNPRVIAREVNKATDGALLNALTTCRTETMRAYRTAAHETYKANDDVVNGWVWSCAHQAHTCAACWGMDGTFHPLSEELVDHPNGKCSMRPMSKTWSEILGKPTTAKETSTSPKGWDPEKAFRQLSEKDQRQVLGKRRFELWQEGKITLRDLPVKERSKVWGDHYRVKTLRELGLAQTRGE